MCSTAVTLGGGITLVNGSRSPPSRLERSALAVKIPAFSQRAYSSRSVEAGSYVGGRAPMHQVSCYHGLEAASHTWGSASAVCVTRSTVARWDVYGRIA